ncbi:hypothetical protein BUALT_Bualt03G0034600 [Buddleja alternifolia]|uniref:Fe2OG dioxygenase domain-containing protein n=1 Tax=Buddleja alternifolia TaxID=168488 RepID=A0AAV6XQR5_9LAMI|nr:hypothetical protein BUALT_Bualt03G0034600 [Buddleja alternifolia]
METKLASSVKVPIVQELAKEKLTTVPPQYHRHDHNDHLILSDPTSLPEIPVINMQNLLFNKELMESELHKLHKACQEWGFFQLKIQEFFDLSIEEKKKYGQEAGDVEGYGQLFVVSEEQKLDWADMFYISLLPTNSRKPHLLPKLPPTFRDAIEAYSAQVKILAMKILTQMAKALHMKAEEMKTLFEEGRQSMRMNYYPPCPQPELVTGLYPHSDANGLTILLQVNEIEGLQINKDGVWIPVSPLPNAFVINIGDILEIVTNGVYRSIEHRATVNAKKERLSIATFHSPNLDCDIGPAPSLVTPETPAKFKRTTVDDYLKGFFSRELYGKSYLDTIRI